MEKKEAGESVAFHLPLFALNWPHIGDCRGKDFKMAFGIDKTGMMIILSVN